MKAAKGTGASGGSGARAQGRAHLEQSLAETVWLRLRKTGVWGVAVLPCGTRSRGGVFPRGPHGLGWEAESLERLRFGDLFNPEGKKQEMHAGRWAAPPGTSGGTRALAAALIPLHGGHVPRLGLPPEAFPGRVHGKGRLGRPRGASGAGHRV